MDAIREVLVQHWDPIGVMDDPSWPRDEYDAYTGPIASALERGDSADLIAEYLGKIEEERMGLPPVERSARLDVAVRLKSISV